jgi:hypothetical protein
MGITAPDWVTLREKIQTWLWDNIPEEVSSKDPMFERLTGLSQARLEKNWSEGGMLTSCNSFAGVIAQHLGVPRSSVLAKGVLDISLAEKEVPGCWQEANSADACLDNITPNAGDIYSGPLTYMWKGKEVTQKWGHVGIVYSYDRDSGMWWLVQGGQGGPKAGADFIRWKEAKFDRTKLNGWINMAKVLMPNGPYATNAPPPERRASSEAYARP